MGQGKNPCQNSEKTSEAKCELPGGQGPVTVELCGYTQSFGDLRKSSKRSFKSASWEIAWIAQADTFKKLWF